MDLDYRLLFECGSECMLIAKMDGEILDANLEACRILRKGREGLISARLDEVFDPTDPQSGLLFDDLRDTGRFEGKLRLLRWCGIPFSTEVSAAAFGEGVMCIVFRDFTGRERSEERTKRLNEHLEGRIKKYTMQLKNTYSELSTTKRTLFESEERFRITFDEAPVGIAHVSPDGRWLRVNRKLCEIVGCTREQMIGLTFQDVVHPEDPDANLEWVEGMLSGDIETYSGEERYVRKDGSLIWVKLTVSLAREPAEDPAYFVSFFDDIDERKRSEEQTISLTPQEVRVLELLARGLSNREIACNMYFSVGTAKSYVQRIGTKLGVSGRVQAAVRAVELGLTQPEQQSFG